MQTIDHMADILALLGNKTRLTILALLKERELCVCELVDILHISQPAVSQHLQRLKAHKIVQEDKRGQWVYYSLRQQDNVLINNVLENIPCQRALLNALNTVC